VSQERYVALLGSINVGGNRLKMAELREAGVTDSEIRNAFAGAISRQPPGK
jgi:uncharacterized protein (DUF1697 family)